MRSYTDRAKEELSELTAFFEKKGKMIMKLYNIPVNSYFYRALSNCKATVKVVIPQELTVEIPANEMVVKSLLDPLAVDGKIPSVTMYFENPQDCVDVINAKNEMMPAVQKQRAVLSALDLVPAFGM